MIYKNWTAWQRNKKESGSALVEFLAVVILLLVPIMWLTISILQIESTKLATDLAARNAARVFAKITYTQEGKNTQRKLADAYIAYAFKDYGIDPSTHGIKVDIRCYPDIKCTTNSQSVRVSVTAPIDFINIPSPFGTIKHNFKIQSTAIFPKEKY